MARLLACAAVLTIVASACSSEPSISTDDDDITVDTSTPQARAQYDANVAFARSYSAQCARSLPRSGRPRVLVTGFGRFMDIENNATGRIVSALVPAAAYPETHPPAFGRVDPAASQLSVGTGTLDVPNVGKVDVCAMILPVYWDLAAILIAKEAEALRPSFVLMNGVAGPRQPLWLELGATNRAARLADGSNQLTPTGPGFDLVKLIDTAAPNETAQPNLLSWQAVQAGARAAVARHAADVEGGVTFGALASGVSLAGYPRESNTYLCNNVTYTTGWLMSHPGRDVRLLRASQSLPGKVNEVRVKVNADFRAVPRVFVHWPSELADKHHTAGADVMKAIIAAQLQALRNGDRPTYGDNALAAPDLASSGPFF